MIGEILELLRLVRHRTLPPATLRALQERKLRAVIRHAYDKVPYYHTLFSSAGLSPEDIRTVEDLKYVPISAKEDLRAAGMDDCTAKGIDLSSCLKVRTSGSTGEPFTVCLAQNELRTRRLLDFRALLSAGFRPRDRLVILGPERANPVRLHYRLGLYRTEFIPPRLPLEEQIRRLQALQPTLFLVHPTALRALLHKVAYSLNALIRPRMLITAAEPCDEILKQRVRADLDVGMFNFYGAIEFGRIAAECPAHEGLHVSADHVLLECLKDDKPVDRGQPGVAVVTNLNAFAMPFIRYRLGDLCTFLTGNCPCGSTFPLIAPPLGREWDMLKLPSGKLLSPTGFSHVLRNLDGITQFRVIQERVDYIVLQLVPQKRLSAMVLSQLQAWLAEYLQEPVRVEVQYLDFIDEDVPKFKAFISRLLPAELW